MTDFTQLTLTTPAQHINTAADIAHMVVSHGIFVEDYRDMEADVQAITGMQMIDETLLAQDRTQGFVHVYLPAQVNPTEAAAWLSERCSAAGIQHEITLQDCRNEDWENNWKAYFHPLPIGERLLIQPTWQEQVNPEGRAVLLLDPGVAFGSGSHATTRLCLQALEQHITPGCTVLDIGCGSGILSIAAALLGAQSAIGVDIDPAAVQNAQENAARNGLAPPQLQFLQGDLAQHITGRFDVIVSNIVADAIISLAPQVSDLLAPGGVWLSSGIIDTRAGDVQAALAAAGFTVTAQHEEEGWVCLAAMAMESPSRLMIAIDDAHSNERTLIHYKELVFSTIKEASNNPDFCLLESDLYFTYPFTNQALALAAGIESTWSEGNFLCAANLTRSLLDCMLSLSYTIHVCKNDQQAFVEEFQKTGELTKPSPKGKRNRLAGKDLVFAFKKRTGFDMGNSYIQLSKLVHPTLLHLHAGIEDLGDYKLGFKLYGEKTTFPSHLHVELKSIFDLCIIQIVAYWDSRCVNPRFSHIHTRGTRLEKEE